MPEGSAKDEAKTRLAQREIVVARRREETETIISSIKRSIASSELPFRQTQNDSVSSRSVEDEAATSRSAQDESASPRSVEEAEFKQVLQQVYPIRPEMADDELVASIAYPAEDPVGLAPPGQIPEIFYRIVTRNARGGAPMSLLPSLTHVCTYTVSRTAPLIRLLPLPAATSSSAHRTLGATATQLTRAQRTVRS